GDRPPREPLRRRDGHRAAAAGRLLRGRVAAAGVGRPVRAPPLGDRAGPDERGHVTDGRSFRERFRDGLKRTRQVLNTPVEELVKGRRLLDGADLASVEEALIAADLGMPAVADALEVLRARSAEIARGGLPAMRALLRDEIRKAVDRPRAVEPFSARPWVV